MSEKIPAVKPLDPMTGWNVKLMNVPMAWQYTKGKGIVVGLIDTRIDITHEDLGWYGGEYITGNDTEAQIIEKYATAMKAVREGTHPTILPGCVPSLTAFIAIAYFSIICASVSLPVI